MDAIEEIKGSVTEALRILNRPGELSLDALKSVAILTSQANNDAQRLYGAQAVQHEAARLRKQRNDARDTASRLQYPDTTGG